jgi:hypothetical protein
MSNVESPALAFFVLAAGLVLSVVAGVVLYVLARMLRRLVSRR